jgi:hypothetical protein
MKKVVVFLQNAWSPAYAGQEWPRDLWLRALWRSRSGLRLEHLTMPLESETIVWWFDNASQRVGARPDDCYHADRKHMRRVLKKREPHYVICLGYVAKCGWARIGFPYELTPCMMLPHPAFRLLTNGLYVQARQILSEGWHGIVELKQLKGEICKATYRMDELPMLNPNSLKHAPRL